jgi:succinylglutamate desuccinylase
VAPELNAFPRELGRYGGTAAGPLVVCVGGLHGNEPAGVFAARRVLDEIQARRPPFRGLLLALTGNRQALARRCRFVDEDLNRMWFPQRLHALRRASPDAVLNNEEAQCFELFEAIEAALAQHQGPAIFLDLHTTSAGGIPFALAADTTLNRSLATSIPAPLVLGLDRLLYGTLLDYIDDRGLAAIGFEGGQNEAPSSIEHNEAALWTLLVGAGCLTQDAVARAADAQRLLNERTAGIPKVLEVRYRHGIGPDDQFVMEPGFVNFQPVRLGQLLARDRNGPITATEDGRILLPLYQSQGSDGFFLVREPSPQ